MQYKKITPGQHAIRSWRIKRNRIANKLLTENPSMQTAEAVQIANRQMGRMPRG